ncbi:D-isomer specific 2-hydroxyacid dehydrogenase family protein [Corynebacterium uterequi]|nr:D-isomer specific 2-hydroxyacid dehydrogenase family protein [Corynebacterium uterequi]
MKFTMIPEVWPEVVDSVVAAGHTYTDALSEAEFLVFNGSTRSFPSPLPDNIGFVQWPFAGVEALIDEGVMTDEVRWANAAGTYGTPVAEVALGLLLGLYHGVKVATKDGCFDRRGDIDAAQQWLFHHKKVLVVGAGGIGAQLIRLLEPFGCEITAVNRSGRPVAGAVSTVPIDDVDAHWAHADVVVLAAPLTDETRGLVDATVLQAMARHAVLVNVGRGGLVVTDDLVAALRSGEIAGAAMDVTDPEPLPAQHPLWAMDNVLITPHIAAPPSVAKLLVADTIIANAAAFAAGERMPTEVDVRAGY